MSLANTQLLGQSFSNVGNNIMNFLLQKQKIKSDLQRYQMGLDARSSELGNSQAFQQKMNLQNQDFRRDINADNQSFRKDLNSDNQAFRREINAENQSFNAIQNALNREQQVAMQDDRQSSAMSMQERLFEHQKWLAMLRDKGLQREKTEKQLFDDQALKIFNATNRIPHLGDFTPNLFNTFLINQMSDLNVPLGQRTDMRNLLYNNFTGKAGQLSTQYMTGKNLDEPLRVNKQSPFGRMFGNRGERMRSDGFGFGGL